MQLGETLRPGSVTRLSVWCKTATMADRFHLIGMRERGFRGEHIPMQPLDPTPFSPDGAVYGAWTYPLFDAILQRRARRFPLGATMPSQGQAFVSPHTPLPLDPVEEALLILADTGVSGAALSDLPFVDATGETL